MYQPQLLTAGDLETLKQQLKQEFATIAMEQAQPSDYAALNTLYAAPGRIFDGMLVIADGATWNPGSGAGPYARIGGSWSKMAAGFSLTTAVQTGATLNVTATSGMYVVLCDCTSNAITVNLPTAVGNTSMIVIKKTDSSANSVTVDASGTQTIDGSLTAVISVRYVSLSLVSDGTNWSIV